MTHNETRQNEFSNQKARNTMHGRRRTLGFLKLCDWYCSSVLQIYRSSSFTWQWTHWHTLQYTESDLHTAGRDHRNLRGWSGKSQQCNADLHVTLCTGWEASQCTTAPDLAADNIKVPWSLGQLPGPTPSALEPLTWEVARPWNAAKQEARLLLQKQEAW